MIEDRRLSDDQKGAVLDVHERALGMVVLAVDGLRANTKGSFENALAVVMPSLGYAFEVAAKMAWALDQFGRTGAMPSSSDVKEIATYPKGAAPFLQKPASDFEVPRRFTGHGVILIFEKLVDDVEAPSAASLGELCGRPMHQGCLKAITAFHAFTRYALLDELLDPDDELLKRPDEPSEPSKLLVVEGEVLGPNRLLAGENERQFAKVVHDLENLVADSYEDAIRRDRNATAERHRHEFLPLLATTYWELFAAVSRVLVDVLVPLEGDHGLGGRWLADQVRSRTAAQVEDWIERGWLATANTHPYALSG